MVHVGRLVRFVVCLCAVVAVPQAALGQAGDSGSIVGYVYDQRGNPIRGVKVIATSPTQIGGPMRLVDAHRGAAAQRGASVGKIYALLVEGVAGLVHRTEEGWCEPVPVKPGGDAHVAGTKVYT